MNGECGEPTSSGPPCAYPAAACPLHATLSLSPRPENVQPAGPKRNLRAIGEEVAERIASDAASPLAGSRVIRSLRELDRLPKQQTAEEEDEILIEVELRGMMMYGIAPRTPEHWRVARKVFGDATIERMTMWQRFFSGGYGEFDPTWVPPLPEDQLPESLRGPQPNPKGVEEYPRGVEMLLNGTVKDWFEMWWN